MQGFCVPRGPKVKLLVFQVAVTFHCIKYVGRRLKDDPGLIRPPNNYILPLTLALSAVKDFSLHKSLGLIRLLLETGADPNEFRQGTTPCRDFVTRYYDTWEPLKPSKRNCIEIIKLLVRYNADIGGTMDAVGFIGQLYRLSARGQVLLSAKEERYFCTMRTLFAGCKPREYVERRYSIPLISVAHAMSGLFGEELARGEFESLEVINKRVIVELIEQLESEGKLKRSDLDREFSVRRSHSVSLNHSSPKTEKRVPFLDLREV